MTSTRGFTLIELMISTTLALMIAGVAIATFLSIRSTVARAEARQAAYASAQRIYAYLHRTLSSMQHSCACVGESTADEVRLVFMRGKEELGEYVGNSGPMNTDLLWEEVSWRRSDGILRSSSSSQSRQFTVTQSFSPAPVHGAAADYSGRTFYNLPLPRRTLDPASPFTVAPGGLNDNMYFPSSLVDPVPPAEPTSLANNLGEDIGDWTDLQRNRLPILEGVSDLSLEVMSNDGSTITFDTSTPTMRVYQGVWLDGRLAPDLGDAPAYASSELARRPRLLRIRFTLTSNAVTPQATVFSFSFATPGMLDHQP